MKYLYAASLLFYLAPTLLFSQQARQVSVKDYEPGIILFKLTEDNRYLVENGNTAKGKLLDIILNADGGQIRKNFPAAKAPGKKMLKNGEKLVDLSRIYQLNLNKIDLNIDSLVRVFGKSGLFEWAQARYIQQAMFTPNDPQLAQQYHHNLIKSFEAWDITKGDTNVVIGITDGGIQFDHEDLKNIKYNFNDPINGIDDDHDGYIDNYRGWNAVNQTNDPTATLSPHGIFTTGISSATVNNGKGVAGLAYNCKYIPVRIDNSNGFNYGFEGIVYAADMGCTVINASWGSTYYTPMGAEVILYAQQRNCLIVAAAGNSGKDEKYYPASYPGVLSVGATGNTDLKWSGSTFSHRVDLVAPGENLRSTWPFNGYDVSSGTSFSAPLVSGAAALLKSKYPTYSAEQLAERLRVTADTSIYQLPGNAAWYHRMGSGRLNVYRSLHDPEIPSVRLSQYGYTDHDNNHFAQAGDTINLKATFKNFLANTKNLNIQLSCNSPYLEFLNAAFNAGRIPSGDTSSNSINPFTFVIKPDAPYNLTLLLKLTYSDTAYQAFEFIEFIVNKDHINLDINNIHTTVCSNGNIGYATDYAGDGIGIKYNGEQLIYYSGLMLGTSAQKTADNAYASKLPGFNHDFVRLNGVRSTNKLDDSNRTIYSSFYTDSASTQRIEVKQEVSASAENIEKNFILIHYTLVNRGELTVSDLHAGIFTDWDIRNEVENGCAFDSIQRLIYAYDTVSNSIYTGFKQLSNQVAAHGYAFNSDGSGGSINLYDGFSANEKFRTLSAAVRRNQSLIGDIAGLIGTSPMNILPGDSIEIAYALVAGNSATELINNSRKAQGLFNFSEMDVHQNIIEPTCLYPGGSINLSFNQQTGLRLILLNADKVLIKSDSGDIGSFAYQGIPSGTYYLRYDFIDQGYWETTFDIQELVPVAVEAETVPEVNNRIEDEIQFYAHSDQADTFFWNFGDGDTSLFKNPVHRYSQTGTYTVTLIASNIWCSDTVRFSILIDPAIGFEKISQEVKLYPIPVSQSLQMDISNLNGDLPFRIYSASGQLIKSGTLDKSTCLINMNDTENGLYLIELELAGEKTVRLFQVLR